ncbi:hypothetical protein F7734_19995 [Scytonema sp. UIC 10036]|nr:hypothetical protein [Scytonema sp. UIC 10036]
MQLKTAMTEVSPIVQNLIVNLEVFYMFPKTFNVDPSHGKAVSDAAPEVGFLAPNVGTFILTAKKGTANFLWQHDLEVDFHSEILKFDKTIDINGIQFYSATISVEEQETGPEQITVSVLFSVEPADDDEGHRIFYKRQSDSDYNVWANDAKKFELHEPALGIAA